MEKRYHVYIMTNKFNRVLYTGVTGNLCNQIWQHRNKCTPGFTTKYKVFKLVFFEEYFDVHYAIAREKQIKAGSRSSKIKLITDFNPSWQDLWGEIEKH